MTRERRIDVLFLLGGAVLTLLMLAALLEARSGTEPGSLALPTLALMLLQVVVLSAAVFFAGRSSRRFEAGNPVRRCWAVLTSGLLLWVLGEATETVYALVWSIEDPFPSVADVFFLLAYPPLIAAFLLFLRAYRQSGFPAESSGGAFGWGVAGVGGGGTGEVVGPTMVGDTGGRAVGETERAASPEPPHAASATAAMGSTASRNLRVVTRAPSLGSSEDTVPHVP